MPAYAGMTPRCPIFRHSRESGNPAVACAMRTKQSGGQNGRARSARYAECTNIVCFDLTQACLLCSASLSRANKKMIENEKREKIMPQPAKILIVDDEPFNVDYLQQELEDLGYATISAANGQEALQKVAIEAPDLILLDVMMPVMDGFTACRLLKENEATQLIPVIIMTVLRETEERIKGIEAGADDFLTKPVDRRELIARIRTAVKLKQAMDRRLKSQETGDKERGLSGPEEPPFPSIGQGERESIDKVFHREGEYWTIAYQGAVCRVRHTLGLRYLASLLRSPHRQIHVLELVVLGEDPRENVTTEGKNPAALTEAGLHVSRLGDAGEIRVPPVSLVDFPPVLQSRRIG